MSFVGQKAVSDVDLGHKHVSALRGLVLNPSYMPMDGMCLDELRMMSLIRVAPNGYTLTASGQEQLQAELSAAEEREQRWQAGSCAHAVD